MYITIVLGIALVASLAFNLGLVGSPKPALSSSAAANTAPSRADRSDDDAGAKLSKVEGELEKKRKELEEVKRAQSELKDELKAVKKKLHDQKEGDKSEEDLKKARAEVERQASIQLDATRAELSTALADIQRLKTEIETAGRKRAAPVKEKTEEAAPAPKQEVVIQKVIRELSESEKERIARLEAQSSNDRKRANELEREVRNLKFKIDKQLRDVKQAFSESQLAKDKFRAVEIRLNRTLMENDLQRRAIFELEKKTGQTAEHALPTAAEIAESDRSMNEKHAAEDKANAEARAKVEAAQAAQLEAEHAAAAAQAAAPAPSAPAVAPAAAAPAPAPTV